MSRLGKIPIVLPEKVEASLADGVVHVKGPKGELRLKVTPGIVLKREEQGLFVQREDVEKIPSRMHGLYRALVKNMVVGVSQGFEKRLVLVGVGFRAQVQGQTLELQVGYSKPRRVAIPEGISVAVEEKNTRIIIKGIDRQSVGQFAAEVRAMRKPEPYKGKGIRYENEYVRKKAGKAAKGKAAGG